MTTRVAHVMRTYGVHGGERQLGQLFSAFADPEFAHLFFFVYRDQVCGAYFGKIPGLALKTLLPLRARAFPSLLIELAMLALCLPVLQLGLLIGLRRQKCRICVAHGVQGGMVAWLAAWLLPGVKFVYIHRGTKSRMGRFPLFRLLYRPYHVVAGVSRASAESLRGLVDGRRLRVLENGIDLQGIARGRGECPPRQRGTLVIICVGRLMPAKGQRLLIEAFAAMDDVVGRECELWVVGDGPDLDDLRRLAESLGVGGKVRFLGRRSDVVCLLAHSDVFAHASESEGLSNAVLEAMAMGLPSVVVDAPGVSECHQDGVTGFVTERAAENVAVVLNRFADDPALRAAMGRQAADAVRKRYSIEANCERYRELYLQLVAAQV